MSQIHFQQQAASGYDQAVATGTDAAADSPDLVDERVLDAASGTGIATGAAAAIVGPTDHVTASDIAPAMVELASARPGQPRVVDLDWHSR